MNQIQGFASLMYVNFVIKKKYRVDETAKEMRIATDTLYRYIRGENIIPPDRIVDLVKATKDIEYLEFFCDPNGFLPIPKVRVKDCADSIKQHEIDLSVFLGKSLEKIEEAYKDNKITKQEYNEIHKSLNMLRKLEAELDEKIKREMK